MEFLPNYAKNILPTAGLSGLGNLLRWILFDLTLLNQIMQTLKGRCREKCC